MWKLKPGIDYSVYYGRRTIVCYNTSDIKHDKGENKFVEGILYRIVENASCVSVILREAKEINSTYSYLNVTKSSTIVGDIIEYIKIEDKDIEFAVNDVCKDAIGVNDLSKIILEFTDKYVII